MECTTKELTETVLSRLVEHQPDVLVASCYIFNRPFVESILKRYRILFPQVKIIAGGPEFLGDNEPLLRSGIYDIIIRGEGEAPMKSLLEQNLSPGNIAGCCHIGENGNYCDNGTAEEIQELDSIPSPYQSGLVDLSKPFVQFETSRGCPNSCAFCTSSLSGRVRFYSMERVKEDLLFFKESGKHDIRVLDRTFNCSPSRTVKLLQMFREEFPAMRFHGEFDPAFLNDKIVAELKLALKGQLHLETGLQTFSEEAYDTVSRKSTMNRTVEGLRLLCSLDNIEIHADLIAGLPGLSLENLYDDVRKLVELHPAEIQLENLKLLPGTPVASSEAVYGAPEPPYEVLATDAMSFSDLMSAREWSRLIDWYYNLPLIQPVFRRLILEDSEFFRQFHQFMQKQNVFGAPLAPEKRFRFLHAFLEKSGKEPQRMEDLICAWYLSRFSPEHGLFPATIWKEEIPESSELICGSPDPTDHWRKYRFETAGESYFICYAKGHQRSPKTQISILKFG